MGRIGKLQHWIVRMLFKLLAVGARRQPQPKNAIPRRASRPAIPQRKSAAFLGNRRREDVHVVELTVGCRARRSDLPHRAATSCGANHRASSGGAWASDGAVLQIAVATTSQIAKHIALCMRRTPLPPVTVRLLYAAAKPHVKTKSKSYQPAPDLLLQGAPRGSWPKPSRLTKQRTKRRTPSRKKPTKKRAAAASAPVRAVVQRRRLRLVPHGRVFDAAGGRRVGFLLGRAGQYPLAALDELVADHRRGAAGDRDSAGALSGDSPLAGRRAVAVSRYRFRLESGPRCLVPERTCRSPVRRCF